jgi:2-methylisocitrate lyase-like PEP mutase family enzyme
MRRTTRFRQRLKEPGIIVMPGVYDPLSAKLVEQAGFEVLYVGGSMVANAGLGFPDVGLSTITELAQTVHRIALVTTLPIYVDADNGFGNAINAMRTVRELEQAGAAGLHLEDQVFPKRCGHFAGKQVVSELEMCKKIEAACEARQDDDFVIIARTDARAVLGFDEAVKRARAYLKAGADGIFFESPISVEELAAVPKLFDAPTQANMVSGGGLTPLMKYQDLEAMGFKMVNYGAAPFQVAVKAILGLLEDIKVTGSTENYLDRMVSFDERQRRVGLPEVVELQKRFGTDE